MGGEARRRVRRSGRTSFTVLLVASASLLVLSSCDTGDGRELREPAVPYVAPTDPPQTSAP